MTAATLSRDLLSRLFAATAAVLVGGAIVWYWVEPGVGLSTYTTSVLLGHIAGVCALLIACAVIWKAWHAPGAPALAVFLIAFCLYNGNVAILRMLHVLLPSGGDRAYNLALAVGIATALAALVRFSTQFPGSVRSGGSKPSGSGNRFIRIRSTAASLQVVGLAGVLVALVLALDALLLRPTWYLGSSLVLIYAFMVLGFLIASLNLWVGYSKVGEEDRRRIVWVGQGVLILAIGVTIPLALRFASAAIRAELPSAVDWYVLALSELGFVLCLAFAVFGRGAIDPTLLFRRTTIAGGLTILGLFFFSGIENLATDLITSTVGLPDWAGTWIAGGLVALAFAPLYRRSARVKR